VKEVGVFGFFRRFGTAWPDTPLDEIRKRARILVIDDSEFFYLGLFQRDGYTVEKWDDIKDLAKVESGYFDVLLLDIEGVGRSLSSDQGLGVLRHLKQVRPTQLVVAYSSADWSLKYKAFFDLADASLAKSADYVEFKRVVDGLLVDRFSLGFYLDRVARVVGDRVQNPKAVRSIAQRAILRRDPRVLEKALSRERLDPESMNLVLQVVQTGITILSTFAK